MSCSAAQYGCGAQYGGRSSLHSKDLSHLNKPVKKRDVAVVKKKKKSVKKVSKGSVEKRYQRCTKAIRRMNTKKCNDYNDEEHMGFPLKKGCRNPIVACGGRKYNKKE